MRAVGLDYESRRLVERAMAEPQISRSSEVLFRVHEVGVCGTDRELAGFRLGYPPAGESFLVLGHEALGRVVEAGGAAGELRAGDWVVPMIRRACQPPCRSCARNRRDLCLTGGYRERGIFGAHGYFSDYAVDEAADLLRVPPELVDFAVLIEPLSVVEKAVERARRMHEGEPRSALVLGAGPIGLLAALALQGCGLAVTLHSLEPADSSRARLARDAGLHYGGSLEGVTADVVIEATGSGEAALRALRCLEPLGVCAVLGSLNTRGDVPFLEMLVNNQAVFGSVNASPQAFRAALADLARFDRRILQRLVQRAGFDDFSRTILGAPAEAPKIVHVLAERLD